MSNTRLIQNKATHGNGGAILLGYASSLQLTRCALNENEASHSGGAIFGYTESKLEVIQSAIISNVAEYGAGIYSHKGEVTTKRVGINNNRARADGGGLYLSEGSTANIKQTEMEQNKAHNTGAAIYTGGNNIDMFFVLITNNIASGGDNGIYCTSSQTINIDCTSQTNLDSSSSNCKFVTNNNPF